ncbi:hypothetical protein VIMS_02463 [Mycobacterium marinum]|uniref:hypothetical protein n=1 Tax=Mycobacterium marinum TaxID=1781 RepID=UPI000E3CF6DD|nr:hypothetical protein [Mycobacterium marinum]RFZ15033.1 hypothetical protein VIMS_02463 [Mycobacterium marinum]
MSTVTYYRSDWTVLAREFFGDSPPVITVNRWLPTDDETYDSLFGPQRLAHRMFGRIDPHWYLRGDE